MMKEFQIEEEEKRSITPLRGPGDLALVWIDRILGAVPTGQWSQE
jgi:hypothetical protein